MLDTKQYDTINKFKRYIPFDSSKESKIYYNKDELYKILYYIDKKYIKILNYINECNLEELIEIRNLIYDKDNLVGYTSTNHKDYKSLRKNKYRKFKLKIKKNKNIITACNKLNDCNLYYGDFHTSNVLLNRKTGNIKMCDLNCISIIDNKYQRRKQIKDAIILCLSYIYNVDTIVMQLAIKNRTKINKDNIVYECIDSIGSEMFEENFNRFENLDFSIISDERKVLKKESIKCIDYLYDDWFV